MGYKDKNFLFLENASEKRTNRRPNWYLRSDGGILF